MDHATSAVTPLDPELVQAGDAVGQRAERRGLLQGSVRPVGVAEILVLPQRGHQVPLVPDQRPVQQLPPAAANPAFHDRVAPHRQLHPIRTIGTDASDRRVRAPVRQPAVLDAGIRLEQAELTPGLAATLRHAVGVVRILGSFGPGGATRRHRRVPGCLFIRL
jgi:hypothetical protein